jgi:ABC-type nitrate/sulfonate/bicarbonate transport system substrate-binding protein
MSKFRIMPHGRLQEWVAEEKGYYAAEGLDYEFVRPARVGRQALQDAGATVQSADATPAPVLNGAFESMEAGRSCEVSSACHWAVNMASSAEHGIMWGHAYSMTPAGIYVAPESDIRSPEQLRDVEVGVGYHSGSHFSALQALSPFISPSEAKLRFIGSPGDRLDLLIDRQAQAANIFGVQREIAEQLGFRKVLDTTFMIGFLISAEASVDDCQKYFNALQKAQVDIDLEPERYKHYFEQDVPERYKSSVDVRAFSLAERLVFEDYTREMYERTHRWMLDLQIFPGEQSGNAEFEKAVLV